MGFNMDVTPGSLLMVIVNIDPADAEDLKTWYEDEHFPEKLAEPGYRSAHLFAHDENAAMFLALYDIDVAEAASPPPGHRKPPSERSKQIIASWNSWTRSVWDELPRPAIVPRQEGCSCIATIELDFSTPESLMAGTANNSC